MSWDDWVGGILTGGLYNIGKAATKAGEAAEDAGEAAEQAGLALAIIGSTIEAVGEQLDSLLEEMEELITIKRLTSRDESDLWEEEKERLDDLKQRRNQLENKLRALGVSEPGSFNFNIMDFLNDPGGTLEIFNLTSSLLVVIKEINEIMYQEPGVVTTAIYNASETLERFNTIEQPMIEDILDSVDDTLEVTEETIQEIKKLFVTKKKVLIPDLPKFQKDKLDFLELDANHMKNLINKKNQVSGQFMGAMKNIPAAKFDISEKGVKITGSKVIAPSVGYNMIRDGPDIHTRPTTVRDAGDTVVASRNMRTTYDRLNISSSDIRESGKRIESVKRLNLSLPKRTSFSRATLQPQGFKISSVMNTKFDGFHRKYAYTKAEMAFLDREILKNAKLIDRIKFKTVDEPGVIPRTLNELEEILKQFKTQEQPRIDTVLDTLNENLEESKETLSKVNESLDVTRGMFSFIKQHGSMIKLGLGIFGVVVFLDFLFLFVVLLRLALGI